MDPERKYGTIVDINHWKCIFCYKVTGGGLSRLKQHLVGGYKNTKSVHYVQNMLQDTQDARLLASCLMALSAMLPPPRLMSSYSISNQEYRWD